MRCGGAEPVVVGLSPAALVLNDDSPQARADTTLAEAISVSGHQPTIISRGQWGADESMRRGAPLYDNGIRAGIVHHTASDNDYSPRDAAGIVRSIYAYHTRILGWDDIVYNALVDKHGPIFEGRYGGVTRSVQGSYTGGFNRKTWAVSMIGNFDDMAPPPAAVAVGGLTQAEKWSRT
jgi:uncharacterized protein with LGFP repeats